MQRKFQRFRQESILASHLCEFHNNEFLYIRGDSPTTVCVEKAILITTVYLDKHFFDWDFWEAKGFRLIFILIAIMRLVFVQTK